MVGVYEHIRIEKELLINDRRTKKTSAIGGISRSDTVRCQIIETEANDEI